MPLDVKLEKKPAYKINDYKRIFTTRSELEQFVNGLAKNNYLKKDEPKYEEKKSEIFKYNIDFIKSIFFENESVFTYNNNSFSITNSVYIDVQYLKNKLGKITLYMPTIELTLRNSSIIMRLTFKIKTKGNYTKDDKDEITYPLGSAIFITPSVKLARNPSYNNEKYKSILTSYEEFKKFVEESIKINGNGTVPIDSDLNKKNTISNLNFNFNVNFIKNIFFPQKSTFKIKDDRYVVNSSSYIDGQYEMKDIKKTVEDKTGIDKNYIAHIELTLSAIPVISGLQFRIKTLKFKVLEKNEKYDSMPDPVFMFITPSVKLTMNDLHYSYINGDYKKLLTSFSDFSALVEYSVNKYGALDKRDPDYEIKLKEILNNNIKLIKSIFFPNKSKYSYRNQNFFIVKSNYIDNDYEAILYDAYKTTINYKGLSISYQTLSSKVKIVYISTLELTFLDIPVGSEQPNQADFNRLSCSEKAEELESQFMYYFDVSLNLFEKPKQTIVIKSEYDTTREKIEKENIKKKKEEEEKRKEDIIRKNLEEKERFLYLKKRDEERKKKEEEELKKKELVKGGKKKSKKVDLYKNFKKNVSRKNKHK